MRFKEPEPFDPKKEYEIGDKVIIGDKVLIAQKYTQINMRHISHEVAYSMFVLTGKIATQCGMCDVDNSVCNLDAPCFKYGSLNTKYRKDRKNINFRFRNKIKK